MIQSTAGYEKCLFAYSDADGKLWLQSADGTLIFPLPLSSANSVQKSGDTMTGPLALSDPAGTKKVTLAIDEATGDLIVTNASGQKINVTGGFIGTQVVSIPNTPAVPNTPQLSSISPASVPAGSPDTTITFTGTGFDSTMKPSFGDHLLSWTTAMVNPVFISPTQFQAQLGANLLTNPTSFYLFIVNSGGQDTQNLPFTVT